MQNAKFFGAPSLIAQAALIAAFMIGAPSSGAADRPERTQRLPASASAMDVERVAAPPVVYSDELSQLVSYDILMSMPLDARLTYLQRVRQMLVELEDMTNPFAGADKSAGLPANRSRLVAEIDALLSYFVPTSSAGGSVTSGGMIFTCPVGDPIRQQTAQGEKFVCRNGRSTGPAASQPVPVTVPPLAPAPPPPPRQVGPAGGPQGGNTAPTTPGAPGGAQAGPQTAPSPYNPTDYDPSKSSIATMDKDKGAGAGYDDWATKAQGGACGFKPKKKKECDAVKTDRDTKKGCFIGGVPSTYTGGVCQPVSKLCYDDNGKQMTNDECKSAKGDKSFSCAAGQTVCSVDIGRRSTEHGNGQKSDKSNGAFCAPASGNGAKSASALCLDLAGKYSKSQGDKSSADILATARGNAKAASTRWDGLKTKLRDMCGGSTNDENDKTTTKANCEACQVMKYRMAQMREELFKASGSGAGGGCMTDDKVNEYFKKCQDSPEKCGGKPKPAAPSGTIAI